jgi:sugar phosphate isomerase/epimerase
MRTHWSFSTNAFRAFSLGEALTAIAECGYSGVEIMADRPHAYPQDLSPRQRLQIKKQAMDLGLEIANINAFMLTAIESFHRPSWIEPDPSYRSKRIECTKQCIKFASEIGAKTLSTEPGGMQSQYHDKIEAMSLFRDGIAELVPVLRDWDITLLIEPEPDLLLETTDDYLGFMENIPWPEVRLNLDVGHLFCVGEDPAQSISRLATHIGHVHLEDIPADRRHIHTQLGDGAMDIPAVLEALREAKYEGWITVELYPYEKTPIETACNARKYLKKYDSFMEKF